MGSSGAPGVRRRSWAPPPANGERPVLVNVAMTGVVPTKADNPSLPNTPDEIVADALRCVDAGASILHLHARDGAGRPAHCADLYRQIIHGIRSRRPDALIVVTTSSRVDADLQARMVGLDLEPDLRPDLASLTLGSYNTPTGINANPPDQMVRLLERMGEVGIRPELEVFDLGMVNTLHVLRERGLIPDPPIVNVLLGLMGSGPAFVGDLASIVDRLPVGSEWAAAGIGQFQRPMTLAAVAMGGNVRTGLEDNPVGDEPGWSNVAAVGLVVAAAELAHRRVGTPDEARIRFGLREGTAG